MIGVRIDRVSLVAEIDGALTLAEVESALAREGLTLDVDLGLAGAGVTVTAWLGDGAPGARDSFRDPADHLVAGFDARLPDGNDLRVRPGPRRAVGPDLLALFFGTRGRFGTLTRAHVRVHPLGVRRPDAPPFHPAPEPELTLGERALLDSVARELGSR